MYIIILSNRYHNLCSG